LQVACSFLLLFSAALDHWHRCRLTTCSNITGGSRLRLLYLHWNNINDDLFL